jgi:hypothetical protein
LNQVRHGESVSPADESVLCADLSRTIVADAASGRSFFNLFFLTQHQHFWQKRVAKETSKRLDMKRDGDAFAGRVSGYGAPEGKSEKAKKIMEGKLSL